MTHSLRRARKPIDPDLKAYLKATAPSTPVASLPADAERVQMGRTIINNALKNRGAISGLPNRVESSDVMIDARLACRLYRPQDTVSSLPVLVYAHGGGWVVGSVETHDPFCRLLSEAAHIMIFSVEYRLAPEHPYPAGLEDVFAAYQWAAVHAGSFRGDPKRLLLGGDSAGANLAAVVANRICATETKVLPEALMLLYPVTDHPSAGHLSYREHASGCGLDANLMLWFWKQYAKDAHPDDPQISPLRLQHIPSLPPTLVATAEYDPLRDEGIAYAQRLAEGNIPVTHLHAPDMHHNFPVHPGTVVRFPQSVTALKNFAGWLQETLRR